MVRRIRLVSRVLRIETEVRSSGSAGFGHEAELPGLDRVWAPSVDVYENETEVVVEVELPGVFKEDVAIVLRGGRLEVKGLKKDLPAADAGVRYHRLEREYGTFRRVVLIPASVLAERASATLQNGILTVVLRKPPRRTRRVELRNAGTAK
jgi:HSP20 family protein